MINLQERQMQYLCNMMSITVSAGTIRSVKNRADKKMVRALDAVPWKERQWGHWLARNTINTKRKLGLGAGANKKRSKFTYREVARKISR